MLIITSCFASLTFIVPRSYGVTTVMRVFNPATGSNVTSVNLGETFSISVKIENVARMSGYEFRLLWNRSILSCTQWNYTAGNTWKKDPETQQLMTPSTPPSAWAGLVFQSPNNIDIAIDGRQRYWVAVASMGGTEISGDFTIATFNFNATGSGETLLDLSDTDIGNNQGDHLPHVVIDGLFKTIIHDVAITGIKPKSSTIIKGSSVEIGVNATNKGNVPQSFTVATYYNSSAGAIGIIGAQDVTALAEGATQSLSFLWNTTGVADGSFVIFANATRITGEINIGDNQLIDGIVEVQSAFKHDVAVTGFAANATVLAKGEVVALTIDIVNQGWGDETDLRIKVYYNATMLGEALIPLLHPGSTVQNLFNFSTADKSGRYDLVANISLVSDVNTTNNEKTLQLFVTQAPIADFTISSSEAAVLQEVTFDASASFDPDGAIAKYTWDFGDSFYLGNGSVVKHVYTKEGNYTVRLTLTDSRGLTYVADRSLTYSCRAQKNFTVKATPPPLVTQDAIYYAAIATIMIEALALAYLVIKRKSKPAA